MKNPYDIKTHPEKHEFFRSMTDSINKFMLEQYPKFDSQLNNQIKYLTSLKEEIRKDLQFHKEECSKHVINKVEIFLQKNYPEISNKFSQTAIELERSIENLSKAVKKHNLNEEKFEKQLEKVVDSNSLYEDVYKMRDEFSEMKKFMETFSKRIKKAFEI